MTACAKCSYDPAVPVLHTWHLRLRMEAVSHNRIDRGGSGKWRYRAYAQLVSAEVQGAGYDVPKAKGKRRVTLTRVWARRQRRFDRINLAGGLKPVLDALVKHRLLVDDSEKWCEDHYEQRGPSPDPGIEVVIEELAE
jgi:Holliday junction resolvase RusA-like endonuclease